MPTDDVWQLQMLQSFAGQVCMNTFAFRTKTGAAVDAAAALALANTWKDFLRGYQADTLTHTGWVLQQVRGGTASYTVRACLRDGGARLEGTYTGTNTGGQVGMEGLPPQVAEVISLGTGYSGRRRRGRSYKTGFCEAYQRDGTITSAHLGLERTAWDTHMAKYRVGGTDPLWETGVWSMTTATGCVVSKTPPFKPVPTVSPDPLAAYLGITTWSVRPTLYSQRRRTIGKGR